MRNLEKKILADFFKESCKRKILMRPLYDIFKKSDPRIFPNLAYDYIYFGEKKIITREEFNSIIKNSRWSYGLSQK